MIQTKATNKDSDVPLPVDVQDAYEGVLYSQDFECGVNLLDDAVEQLGIYLLSKGIAGAGRPLRGHWLHHCLHHQHHPAVTQPATQLQGADMQQVAEHHQVGVTGLGWEGIKGVRRIIELLLTILVSTKINCLEDS